MGTFSPWYAGTPSYSTYSNMDNLGSMGNRPSIRQVQHEVEAPVSMPHNTTTVVQQSPTTQRKPAQQQQNPMMNNIKQAAKLASEFKKQFGTSNITGIGPSKPGYAMGMDLSGENAILAADAQAAMDAEYGAFGAEALGLGETAPAAAELTATGTEAGLAASGAAEFGGAVGAEGMLGTGVAEGVGTGVAATEVGAGTAAVGEGATAAAGGISATGVGAIVAAAAAAILGIESSSGWHGQKELDRQWMEGIANIQEGDIGSLAANWVTNPWDYAVQGGDQVAENFLGIDASMLPATAINNLFT